MTPVTTFLKPKLPAFFAHLFISLLIFVVVLYFILFKWYPEPFFTAQGGWQGIRLMAFVDIVLGPLLTLVAFNPSKTKTHQAADLSVIALCQITALIWGGWQVYQQRPVALSFYESAFYTITEKDLADQDKSVDDLAPYGEVLPVFMYAKKPDTAQGLQAMLERMQESQTPPFIDFNLLKPAKPHMATIASMSQIDIHQVIGLNNKMKTDLTKLLGSLKNLDQHHFIPAQSKYHHSIFVYDSDFNLLGSIKAPGKPNQKPEEETNSKT